MARRVTLTHCDVLQFALASLRQAVSRQRCPERLQTLFDIIALCICQLHVESRNNIISDAAVQVARVWVGGREG